MQICPCSTGKHSHLSQDPHTKSTCRKIWDHAAGVLVVEEAGGKVSDIYGLPFDFSCGTTLSKNYGLVATNGFIHDKVIDAIQATFSNSH